MMVPLSPLAQTRVIYQWLRIEQLDQWWHWAALGGLCVAVLLYVLYWYRKDTYEQPRLVGIAMSLLRAAALLGLLLYFLQLDKRTEQRIVRDSRVAILVDTSMSMSLPGTPSSAGVTSGRTRAEEANLLVGQSKFLEQLAERHQVSVYRFDRLSRPTGLAALEKAETENGADNADAGEEVTTSTLASGQRLTGMAMLLAAACLGLLITSLGAQVIGAKDWKPGNLALLLGAVAYLAFLGLFAVALLQNTNYPIANLFGANLPALSTATDSSDESADSPAASYPDDWAAELAARGTESRVGDAIKSILDRESGAPLAGIVILTDGRNNAGIDPKDVLFAAQNSRVPLYVIGLGSAKSPPNVAVVEADIPKRLYPGDRFTATALIGSSGFEGKQISLQILSGPIDADLQQMTIEDEKQIELPTDGSLANCDFQLQPKSVGNWRYATRVIPLDQESDLKDNIQWNEVEVVERKNRVLILAGGPTREYQFVRNLLYRDRDVESHVLLQTGTDLTSQEAQKLLQVFPADRQELAQYDAVLAFDADWTQISDQSVQALEQWVAEQAGGFLIVAGSVEMPKWVARSASGLRSSLLRSLSPVVLEKRGSALLASGRIESDTPWPLTVTADGEQTEFLWVTDEVESSLKLWREFQGVHGFYSAYELKPGAKSLLHFSDPTAGVDGQQPVYLASQFYGAGRTVFVGGGEIWRIRSIGDEYFDRFYTKLVRWISQGRLLLDSDRGVLLVDREQAVLGDQVALRAVLKNERYEPLLQSEVVARLIDPQQSNIPIVLRPMSDGSQPGVYTGQFPILLPGEYTAQLQLGGLASNEILTASVKAKVPALEMQRAERNDELLRQLAVESGGKYWVGVENAVQLNAEQVPDIIQAIQPQDQVAYLPGTPDRVFQLRWLGWLMAWIAGCLSLEWLARRLHRLA